MPDVQELAFCIKEATKMFGNSKLFEKILNDLKSGKKTISEIAHELMGGSHRGVYD